MNSLGKKDGDSQLNLKRIGSRGRNLSTHSKNEIDEDKHEGDPYNKELNFIKTIYAMADEMDIVDFDKLNSTNKRPNNVTGEITVGKTEEEKALDEIQK